MLKTICFLRTSCIVTVAAIDYHLYIHSSGRVCEDPDHAAVVGGNWQVLLTVRKPEMRLLLKAY